MGGGNLAIQDCVEGYKNSPHCRHERYQCSWDSDYIYEQFLEFPDTHGLALFAKTSIGRHSGKGGFGTGLSLLIGPPVRG